MYEKVLPHASSERMDFSINNVSHVSSCAHPSGKQCLEHRLACRDFTWEVMPGNQSMERRRHHQRGKVSMDWIFSGSIQWATSIVSVMTL